MAIEVAVGKSRPHEPVQAAKLASEAGIILRSQVPIFTRWKEYESTPYFDSFMGRLAVSPSLQSLTPFVTFHSNISHG